MTNRPLASVLSDIMNERRRQNEKWGEQNHPDGTGSEATPLDGAWCHIDEKYNAFFEEAPAPELAAAATKATDRLADAGMVTWADILLEEVFEALAESDPAKLRTELIQVAAVATQWVEAIDRRNTQNPTE